MAKKSITKRWLINNLGVVLMILLIIEMVFIYVVQNYYYSSAKQYLVSKLNAVTSILSLYADDTSVNFSSEVRNMLENFSEKDKMELMAINSKGHIALTSSGFSPDSDTVMNDYEDAIKSDNNYGYYIGKQDGDEKIMAAAFRNRQCNYRLYYSYDGRLHSYTAADGLNRILFYKFHSQACSADKRNGRQIRQGRFFPPDKK